MSEIGRRSPECLAPATSGALQSPERGGAAEQRRRLGRLFAVLLACACALTLAPSAAGAAEIVVSDTRDRVDASVGNGLCRTSAGTCTVRAAIQEANALPGHDVIEIPAGVYELEIPSVNDDLPGTGDHDIVDTVTLVGAGAGATILDGGFPLPGASPEVRGLDRLLEIHPTAGDVTISDLTLRNGFVDDSGGAIQNWSPRRLRLEHVHVLDSLARKDGGGINNADPIQYEWTVAPPAVAIPSGRVEIIGSTLSGNAAGGVGAAVNNVSTGSVSITAGSRVVDNPGLMVPDPAQVIDPLDPDPVRLLPAEGVYPPNTSAIANKGEFDTVGTIHVADSTVSDNFAPQSGAGIQNVRSGRLVVERSTFSRNTTEADGGAIYSGGGTVTVTGSTFEENLAHASGAGLYSKGNVNTIGQRPRVTIADSTFSDGVAWAHAGAIYNDGDADMTVTDVTVEDNHAEDAGGGLATFGRSTLMMTRGTFTGNAAHGEGGGLFTAADRSVKVADSLFAENSAGVPGLEGHDAAGGGVYTETGPVEISESTIAGNTSTEHGGGLYIDNHGDVLVTDTLVRDNFTPTTGGGIENSGTRVTFERLTVANNRAGEDGGGIYNSSSGEFTVLDSTIRENRAISGGGFTNAADSTLIVRRSLLYRNVARRPANMEDPENGGLGGGFYSISDGNGLMENSTVSSNTANVRGGGMFHDADAAFRISNTTVWRNSAPFGGGISTVESDFVPSIPPQPNPLTLRNTIVGGSLQGGSCDAMLTSHGGNLDSGTGCMFQGQRDRGNSNAALDAIADNGGPTLTHAPRADSLAVDWGLTPCPEEDQRGVARPQHLSCDAGAVEYDGPVNPPDVEPPDTEYLTGPVQDSLETVAFTFTGSDDKTPESEMAFECRLVEHELTEPPEILAPWDPIDPELMFVSCQSGWQRPLIEDGTFTFEVRAIDRAGNIDPTPAVHHFSGDTTPPDTFIADKPPELTSSHTATFTFAGTDNITPSQFLEFECRLDSRDPEMWLECLNPTIFSNLTTGQHTIEVRAIDGAEMIDPTPARYTWIVGQPDNCDQANITLTASADGWVDEVNPLENYLFETELTVRSDAEGSPETGLVPANARALVRFPIPMDTTCELESATLRLYSDSHTEDRTLHAVPLAGTWRESTVNWQNQPGTAGASVTAASGEGYREWNVMDHVNAMIDAGVNHGWSIRDSAETAPDGGEQSFISREMPQDPPPVTLPQLVLRYEAAGSPPPERPTLPADATPTPVHCGQTITQSTLVGNDLIGCMGEGLIIGAPDIVLDLNGHTVRSGMIVEPGEEDGLLAGIRNSGHRNVVIRNGTVQNYGYGVLLTSGTTFNLVQGMTLDANMLAGIELNDADDGRNGNEIRGNTLTSNGEGAINLFNDSENSVIADNMLDGNAGVAFHLVEARGHRIEGNVVSGVPIDPLLDSDGGALLEGSSDNVIIGNSFSDSGDAGIDLFAGSHRNRIEGNTLVRTGDAGVRVEDSDRNQVIGNTAHQASDAGVVAGNAHDTVVRDNDLRFNPGGVAAANTHRLVVRNNNVSDTRQDGIGVGTGLGMEIVDNVANRTGGAGISVEGGAFDAAGLPVGGALIEGNEANENRSDGIAVADGGHVIGANEAHNNAGFGIDAGELPVDGGTNVDGGGNRASGNAEPEQCRGVVCITSGTVPLTELDLTAPETQIDTHPPDPTQSTLATFTFSATDARTPATAMVYECRLDAPPDPPFEPEPDPDPEPPSPNEPPEPPDIDTPPDGEGWAECISPVRLPELEEGRHRFEARATDQADNRDLTPAVYEWSIEPVPPGEEGPDELGPETRISAGPPTSTFDDTATFRFAGSDNLTPGSDLRYQCSLDGGAFEDCATPKTYVDLGYATHTFAVRAVDRSGNVDPTPSLYTWEVLEPEPDTTPPETMIDSGPDRVTVRTNATFTFSANDPAASFECRLDEGPWAECESPLEYTGLNAQAHLFEVRGVDQALNTDPSPARYAWTVGTAPVPTTAFCGQVLTQSTLVRNDLADCQFDGLVIGADGITVDLDGHTIDGVGGASGIRNDGHDDVTIRNGRVVQYDYGVALNTDTQRNIVEAMALEGSEEAGIVLGQPPQPDPNAPVDPPDPLTSSQSNVADNILRDNSIVAGGVGIWLSNATRGTVARDNSIAATSAEGVQLENAATNRIVHNDITGASGYGIALQGSSDNTLADNALSDNNGGVLADVTDTGTVGLPSDGNRIERNTIEDGGGLRVIESGENELIDNVVTRSSDPGLVLEFSRDNLVRGNDLRNNNRGISLKSSSGNRIEGNDASQSQSTGVVVADLSFSNVLLQNTSSDNQGDGIYIGDEAPPGSGSLLERNRTENNNGMGIYVPKPSHTLTANSSNDNGNWGIYVGEPSNGRVNVDGGGNRATGNNGPLDPMTLLPLQCFIIQCAGGAGSATDVTAPDTSILDGPPATTTNDRATFRFTGSDNASSVEFQCQLDGSGFGLCTSPASYESLAPGVHTFQVRAVDGSGNVDLTPATHTWEIAAQPLGQPPETTIDSGPDLTTVSTSATFTFSADESGASFECALDGPTYTACTSPATFTGLSTGTHTLLVRATDGDSNADATPAAYTWRVAEAPVPAAVACGDFIVESISVQNDIVDCPGHGLIVGAPGITIDLNGHVIDGVGQDAGILNHGHDSVTVMNGTVREFDYGVQLNPGTGLNVLTSLRLEANQEAGAALADADEGGAGTTVRGNTFVGNGFGLGIYSGTRGTVVRDNTFTANQADGVRIEHSRGNLVTANRVTVSGGFGIVAEGGGENTIVRNVLESNGGAGIAVGAELLPSNDNRVEENTVRGSNGPGIAVTDSTGNRVLFNTVRESNGAGLVLELARNTTVRGNDLRGNAGGIELSEASGNLIESNNSSGTLGTGIALETSSINNIVRQNTVSGNGGDGIAVEDSAPSGQGNLIAGNTADSNGDNGIAVNGVGHTVTANTARSNGTWGIYAPVGATDGGGNFAAGNVEPEQCLGVVCEIGSVPGAPDTQILLKPSNPSNSRNAAFTYTGTDDTTPLQELIFECRLDSASAFAWEDCEYPHEVLNLSPGEHTLEIRAVDGGLIADPTPASYTWTYVPLPSGRAPEVILDVVPEAETWTLDAIFTFHADEPDVSFECRVDTNAYEPCGWDEPMFRSQGAFEWGLEETEVGLHTFRVRATDFEGNVGQPTLYTWRLLGVVTQFVSGPGFIPAQGGDPATGGDVASSSATIDFAANVSDATYECSLDLEPFEPCSPPVTYTGLAVGEHQLRVIATDLSNGVEELEVAVYEWEVISADDTTPPQTLIERAPANGTSSTIFEFVGTDDLTPESLITYQCRLDSTNELDWFECTSPLNLLDFYTYQDPQMAPGEHTFEVRAIDAAEPLVPDPSNPEFEGNVDPTPAVHTWTAVADTVAPGTGILAAPPARTGEPEATFEFFGNDNATPDLELTFECSVDALPFEPCDSPQTVSLDPGEHTFRVRSVDLAGNADTTPSTHTWTVVAPPVTTITGGPLSPSSAETVSFSFTADQAGSTLECALNGADFVPCTSPYAVRVEEDGTHEFEVRATNPEGVVEEPPSSYEWTAVLGPDTGSPNTTITATPPTSTSATTATFSFTGSDSRTLTENLEFECSLDGAAFESCESPAEFTDLTRGAHVLLVRAIDLAGNIDPTAASFEWTVAPPPATTIISGPDDPSEASSVTFSFSTDVPGSTFECWLDGPKGPCTSPVTYHDVQFGEHIFAVRATDPGGQANPIWTEWEWTRADTSPPITTIHSGPGLETEDTRAEFSFSANEPGVTFQCSLDGADFRSCTSPRVYPRLHVGTHRFEVQAIAPAAVDQFGRPIEVDYDPVVASYEWTIVDTTAPDTFIEWGPPATTASVNAVLGLGSDDPAASFECSLDGAPFESCESPAEFGDLLRTGHTLAVRAIDFAGNVDATPATHAWTIVEPPLNTAVGTNVTVELPMPDGPGVATVNLFEVTLAGGTVLDALLGGAPLPAGYSQAGARFYELTTTAEFGEPVTVCLPYEPASLPSSAVRLLEADGSVWVDVTLTNNPATGQVCGEVENFAGLAIAAATSGVAPLVSITSAPPNPSTSGTATFAFVADMADTMTQCSIDGQPFTACTSPVTFTHLESGDQEFMVQAIGPFGMVASAPTVYEWEIILPPDTTPPDTTITKGPGALTGNYISSFEFTGTDDQTHTIEMEFECSVDGGPFESCSPPEEVEVLTPGQHTLQVRAVDETGNVDPTPATRTWTVVDVSAPDTSIELGPEEETQETSATFEFIGEEPDGTIVDEFECSLDGGDFVACTSPHTIHGLSGGPHVLQVRAKDAAGLVDPTPDFYEWLVIAPPDTTAPDTSIILAPPATSGPDVRFGFLSNELTSGFECSLDGAAFADCESVHELEGLPAGAHSLLVRAVDLALNVDPTPAEHAWTSVAAPDTTIDSAPPNPSQSQSAGFTFSSDQAGVTFQCSVDGSEFSPCTSPFTAGPLENLENHEFEVRAVSSYTTLEGEPIVDETPASYSWLVQVPPDPPEFDTFLTSTPPAVAAGGPETLMTFTFVSDPMATFECSVDGGPWEECESPTELESLADGEHTFAVRAVDLAEVPDDTPATYTWIIEQAPDTTLLTSSPAAQTEGTTATFTFSSDRTDATFECSLDAAAFTACVSGITYTDVPYGEHEFVVRAKGPVGSVDPTPESYTWESGLLTAPTTVMVSTPPASTESTTATFEFTSNDLDAQFLCSLDGAPPSFCTSPRIYENVRPGQTHSFEVQATKPHLLVESTPATFEWTIDDVTPPDTTIASGPAAQTGATTATFAFTGADDGTLAADLDFECSLDGATFEPCTSPEEYTELAVGAHQLEVRAIDQAGLADPSPALYAWTVVELTTIDSGPDSPSASPSATFTFSGSMAGATFQCSLDGADFAACSSPHSVRDLTDGEHTLAVRSSTGFGLWDETPAEHTWTVALPAGPDTTIDLAPAETTVETAARFEFSSDQADATFDCSLDGAAFADCTTPAEYAGLAGGAHRFEVRAVNADGIEDASPAFHEWTVDLPPDTTIESGPPASTVSTSATFAFSSDEPDATFECALDGDSFGSCSASEEYTDLAVGGHVLQVRAKDSFGSVDPTPATYEWTIEPLPDTTIDSGPEDPTESRTATFEFSSDRAGATFECRIDEQPSFSSCESGRTYTDLAFGEHDFLVRAVDPAGNADPTPAEYSWEIGEIPANVTIDSAPAASTVRQSATFEFTADEPGTAFECALDAAAFAPCESPKGYSELALGEHTFQVRALASADAVADAPIASHTWTIQPPPECTASPVTLSANADSWIDQSSPSSNKGSDSVLKVMSKSSSSNTRALLRFPNPALPQDCGVASATLRLYASSAASSRSIQALRVTSAWTEGGVTWSNQPSTNGTASSVTSGTGYREWNVTSHVAAMYIAGANHGFLIRDLVENAGGAEQQFNSREKAPDNPPQLVVTFGTPDITDPQTTISSGPNPVTTSRSATLTFSSDEGGSTFECSLDGGAWAACTSPRQYTSLDLGAHNVRVRAKDPAGNVDATPARYDWLVEPDTTAPETTITSAPAATTSSTTASFAFTADEAGSTFECSLDNGAWAACTSPRAYSSLALGSHEFRVRATDGSGNTDGSPATHAWTIEAASCTAPAQTVGADRDSWVLQSSASSNNGTDSALKVDSKSGANARALVRFALPTIPNGCQVTSVRLRLHAASYKSGRTLNALRLNGSWTEGGVTWSNQPATTGGAATAPSRSSSGYMEWTVTSQVQSMYSGTNHGFLIRDATEGGGGNEQSLHSREKAPDNPPQLVITFG